MKRNILIVGQTPPPVNGQSVMIQEMLNGEYDNIRLHHVRMDFSRTADEIGNFQLRKLLVLLTTLFGILRGNLKSRANILYYPPAGPTLVPVIRDLVLLIGTRWMFRYTVFHFHAAGLPEIYPRLPKLLRPLYNLAYRHPDLAIFTTKSTSEAGVAIAAKTIATIPLGIPDSAAGELLDRSQRDTVVPCILFMGILCEGKGLLTLIAACSLLRKAGFSFRVICAGANVSEGFKEEMERLIGNDGMTDLFSFPGVLRGEEKTKAFREADVFCFPSHYHAESFGVVLIEAMSFALPIVTTRWRGIPDVVDGSGGAFIVEPRMPEQIAEKCEELLQDSQLRAAMGKRNREWFCTHYTIDKFRKNMEEAFLKLEDR